MLINMESGAYDKVPSGQIDLEFDATTLNPGDFAFEKTISGAYQGGLTGWCFLGWICCGAEKS